MLPAREVGRSAHDQNRPFDGTAEYIEGESGHVTWDVT